MENHDPFPLTNPTTLVQKQALTFPIVLFPNGGETLSDNISITWHAVTDSKNHSGSYNVLYSPDNRNSWIMLSSAVAGINYEWGTRKVMEGFSTFHFLVFKGHQLSRVRSFQY